MDLMKEIPIGFTAWTIYFTVVITLMVERFDAPIVEVAPTAFLNGILVYIFAAPIAGGAALLVMGGWHWFLGQVRHRQGN